MVTLKKYRQTRSRWLNCALRDDEAVYWVSIGHFEAVAVGNWWYWVRRGHVCLYILHKVEIWAGVTDAWLTHWQTLKDSVTQLLIKYKSGAVVTQYVRVESCIDQTKPIKNSNFQRVYCFLRNNNKRNLPFLILILQNNTDENNIKKKFGEFAQVK